MAYYRGDYYRGDYYRGGIFSTVARVARGATRAVGALGIPVVSNVARAAASVIPAGREMTNTSPSPVPAFSLSPGTNVTRAAPGGSMTVGVSPLGTVGAHFTPGRARGTHLNRSGYYTRQGYVAPGTREVPNRSMNAGNARAARKAIARIKSARRLLQSIERQLPHRTVRSCKHRGR